MVLRCRARLSRACNGRPASLLNFHRLILDTAASSAIGSLSMQLPASSYGEFGEFAGLTPSTSRAVPVLQSGRQRRERDDRGCASGRAPVVRALGFLLVLLGIAPGGSPPHYSAAEPRAPGPCGVRMRNSVSSLNCKVKGAPGLVRRVRPPAPWTPSLAAEGDRAARGRSEKRPLVRSLQHRWRYALPRGFWVGVGRLERHIRITALARRSDASP